MNHTTDFDRNQCYFGSTVKKGILFLIHFPSIHKRRVHDPEKENVVLVEKLIVPRV